MERWLCLQVCSEELIMEADGTLGIFDMGRIIIPTVEAVQIVELLQVLCVALFELL
jgi:hypothetical protein